MFSKFLQCKGEEALDAVKLQFQMEFANASRKFKKNKKKTKKKAGRPPLGALNLSKLLNTDNKLGNPLDFSKIARSVATTRNGRRVYKTMAKEIEDGKKSRKKVCFCFHVVCFLSCILFDFFVFFVCILITC